MQTERLRDYCGPMTNTDIWQDFALRPDDIIVTTPPKCGTTWTLSIVMMLIHGRAVPEAGSRDEAPWLDCGFRDRTAIAAFLDGLTRRRCIKSHTPLDGIPQAAEPTYIAVYRHPIDAHFSFRNHVALMKEPGVLADLFPADVREGFHRFVEEPVTDAGTDNQSLASIVHHYTRTKARENDGNVHFCHYADLSRDLPGQIARLAKNLQIDLPPATLRDIAVATTFDSMRNAAEASDRRFHEGSAFRDEAKFFDSGTSGKWEGRLTSDDLGRYGTRLTELLADADANWLEWGDRRRP